MTYIVAPNGIYSHRAATGTAATQDHMIYGKRKNSPLTAAYFDRFSHALELESW